MTSKKLFWREVWAEIIITREDLVLLQKCAMHHYDSVCRMSVHPGPRGFINGWYVRSICPFSNTYLPSWDVQGTFGEFDICCKILEQPTCLGESHTVIEQRTSLTFSFKQVLKAMNEAYQNSNKILVEYPQLPPIEFNPDSILRIKRS